MISVDDTTKMEPKAMERAVSDLAGGIDALQDGIKRAYLEALQRCPELVASESRSQNFLIAEGCNLHGAALRLVRYWEKRKELFGDRAFLPMTQTGEGAMEEADAAFLRSGFLRIRPRNGQTVICFAQFVEPPKEYSRISQFRSIFYALSVASQQEEAAVVVVINHVGSEHFDAAFAACLAELVREVMPVRLKSFHLMFVSENNEARISFMHQDYPAALDVLGKAMSTICHGHVAESGGKVLVELAPFGIEDEDLPPELGGTWDAKDQLRWHEERVFAEHSNDERKKSPSTKDAETTNILSHGASATPESSKIASPMLKRPTDEAQSEVVKRMRTASDSSGSVIKKRSGASKYTASDESLKEEIMELAGATDEESKKDFYRKRNALYSRRKYMRKKIEIDVLRKQSADLQGQNRDLKEEGDRLEGLLAEANHFVNLYELQSSSHPAPNMVESGASSSFASLGGYSAATAQGMGLTSLQSSLGGLQNPAQSSSLAYLMAQQQQYQQAYGNLGLSAGFPQHSLSAQADSLRQPQGVSDALLRLAEGRISSSEGLDDRQRTAALFATSMGIGGQAPSGASSSFDPNILHLLQGSSTSGLPMGDILGQQGVPPASVDEAGLLEYLQMMRQNQYPPAPR